MKRELILREKQNIFVKIRKFFYNMFHKTIENNDSIQNINEIDMKKSCFIDDIKAEVDFSEIARGIETEEFLNKIKEDDTILESLSIDRLKKLEKFYEDRINKKKEILKNLNCNN